MSGNERFEVRRKAVAMQGLLRTSKNLYVEREKGFEPSTSTLARLHSTTELFPQNGARRFLLAQGGRCQAGLCARIAEHEKWALAGSRFALGATLPRMNICLNVVALVVGAIVALGSGGCKTNPAGKVPADVSIIQYKSPDIAEITGIEPPDEDEPTEPEPAEEPVEATPAPAPVVTPAATPAKTPAVTPAKTPAAGKTPAPTAKGK